MASQVTATMCALEWKWHPSKSEAEQRRLKMSGAVGRYFLWELNNITPQFTVNPDLKSEYCTPIFSWDYLIPKSCLRYSGNKGSVLSSLQYLRSLDEGWLMEGAVVKSINKYKELKGSIYKAPYFQIYPALTLQWAATEVLSFVLGLEIYRVQHLPLLAMFIQCWWWMLLRTVIPPMPFLMPNERSRVSG